MFGSLTDTNIFTSVGLLTMLACLLFTCSCAQTNESDESSSALTLTSETQTATLRLDFKEPSYHAVNETGDPIHMPDGLPIVLDDAMFMEQVLPRLGGGLADSLELKATFHLVKENVTVGVVEGAGGEPSEVGKTYWVVKLESLESVRRNSSD